MQRVMIEHVWMELFYFCFIVLRYLDYLKHEMIYFRSMTWTWGKIYILLISVCDMNYKFFELKVL